MRIFAGAGEASGDRMLASLLRELKARLPAAPELRGFGGPLSAAQGLESLFDLRDLAVNGVGDVLRNAVFLARARARLRRGLREFRPDLVILADFPGMNTGLARLALRCGVPVHLVAPPQLWAYRNPEPRLRRLRAALAGASLQVLFPFERGAYEPWAARLCQGHFFSPPADDPPAGRRLLLCPGSRRGVLRRNLPPWLARLRGTDWAARGIDVLAPPFLAEDARAICAAARGDSAAAEVLTDREEAFGRAASAIAFPGTITLELFLRRIPARAWAVIDPLTWQAGRWRLRGPHLSLPNVLSGRELLPEWAGTARGFGARPPALPDPSAGERVAEADVREIWERMGSPLGAREGARACLELLAAGRAVS